MYISQGETCYREPEAMQSLLSPCGITWDCWPVVAFEQKVSAGPGAYPEIIAHFQEPLAAIKAQHGYLSEDIVSMTAETPNLDQLLAKFEAVHHHSDDEVRVVLSGEGIFGIVPEEGPPFEIHVETGDLIIVPAFTRHWFTLKESRRIVALRIFKTPAGWTAIYEPVSNPDALPA